MLLIGSVAEVNLEQVMDESVEARYWCHLCNQMVNPVIEFEIKCPFCQSGFVEEMTTAAAAAATTTTPAAARDNDNPDPDADRSMSLWAPILSGMMGNPRNRRRFSRMRDFDDDDNEDDDDEVDEENRELPFRRGEGRGGETELDRELQTIIRRRRRSSATILQLLQSIRAGMALNSENSSEDSGRDGVRERERVILINNRSVLVQGSYDPNHNHGAGGSLGDYFVGPGLDLLLQHLAENDPNRYGTPPAQKEAVEAMPSVKVEQNLQCSVCLDDFEIGAEAKEMPCKHKFHSGCILPWLELHSSCPVCRSQLPADEFKHDSDVSRSHIDRMETVSIGTAGGNNHHDQGIVGEEGGDGRAGRRFSILWPFTGFFATSGSDSNSGDSTSTSSGNNANGNYSRSDEGSE